MSAPVFWMTDPEADAIKSPFVRQPHYNDLENRITQLEAALTAITQIQPVTGKPLITTLLDCKSLAANALEPKEPT